MDGVVQRAPVLIVSTASGAGHVRAANALLAACGAQGLPATHCEVLQHATGFLRWVYRDAYAAAGRYCPGLLGWIYRVLDRPGRLRSARLLFDAWQTRAFRRRPGRSSTR